MVIDNVRIPVYLSNGKKNPVYTREINRRRKQKILELLGNQCRQCHIQDPRILQIDHINGDGGLYRKNIGRGLRLYLDILADDRRLEKYQLLCANCHAIKSYEKGELKRRTM